MQSGSRMTCSAGYKPSNDSGITRCIDVDECNEQLHSCELDERCVNEIGSYRCDILGYFNYINEIKGRLIIDYLNEKKNRCIPTENNRGTPTTEINHDQRDDRFSRGYQLEGTSISSVTNEVEDCGDGYFFDRKSGRCIGKYYLFLHQIKPCCLLPKINNSFENLYADVDECVTGIATCSVGERCVNTEGSYRCSPICPPGFRLRNNSRSANKAEEFCEDINECLLGLHTCNSLTHYCLNTNGSYICGIRSTVETTISTTTRRFVGSRYNRVQVLGISRLMNYIDMHTIRTVRKNLSL